MKKSKIIQESLILPHLSMISSLGAQYIKNVAELSAKVYNSTKNFTIQYGQDSREAIDVFLPADKITNPLPILIFIHGGYWLNGAKEMMGYIAQDILSTSMIFISVGYKLAPEFKFPTALNDCKRGIIKAYKTLDKYGGDISRIIIAGHSAGGQIAMLLVLQKHLIDLIPESHIKLCASISGIFNIYDCPVNVKNSFIGKEEDYIKASPLYCDVSNINVPFLLTIGSKDFPNIQRDHELMLAKMKYYNCPVYPLVCYDKDHFELTLCITKNEHEWMQYIKTSVL